MAKTVKKVGKTHCKHSGEVDSEEDKDKEEIEDKRNNLVVRE